MPKKRCGRCVSTDLRNTDKCQRLRSKLDKTQGELNEAHELLDGKGQRKIGYLERKLDEAMKITSNQKENSNLELECYQNEVAELLKELHATKECLKESEFLVLQHRREELRLKQHLMYVQEEAEKKTVQLQECIAERRILDNANNKLTLQMTMMKTAMDELQKKNVKKGVTKSKQSSKEFSMSMSARTRPIPSKSPFSLSASASPLTDILPKGVAKAGLKESIFFAVPNFRHFASMQIFDVFSDSMCLAGFRWALRVSGRKTGNEPAMLSLMLWAQGPEDQRKWDVTVVMVFRVKRHYSATNVEMNRVKHIECQSAPTEFTNRTVPERTMLGFRMAELDILADHRNGFVFPKHDHLYVEVKFDVKRTKYTL